MLRVTRITSFMRRREPFGAFEPDHPCLPPLPEPEDDEHWLALRAEVRKLEPMREVNAAAQECQIAVTRLIDAAQQWKGPVGDAATRSLHRLTLDLHHECRRLRSGWVLAKFGAAGGRASLVDWLGSPVDSGQPVRGSLARPRAIHLGTAVFRMVAAIGAGLALALGAPVVATIALIGSLLATGTIRYRTNAESASTFRARYLSCFAGHLGDAIVLSGAAVFLYQAHPGLWFVLPLAMIGLHLFGAVARTGTLGVGVHVPRLRVERLVRLFAMAIGLIAVSAGLPHGFIVSTAIMVVWFGFEAGRSFVRVWEAGATEIAWTALTESGFTSEVLTAPSPGDVDSTWPQQSTTREMSFD